MNSLAPKFGSGTRIPTPLPPRCRPRQPAARGNGRLYRYTANAAQAGRRSGVSVVAASATSISAFSPAKYVVGRMRREKGEGRREKRRTYSLTRGLSPTHLPTGSTSSCGSSGAGRTASTTWRPSSTSSTLATTWISNCSRLLPPKTSSRATGTTIHSRRFTRDDSLAMIPCW